VSDAGVAPQNVDDALAGRLAEVLRSKPRLSELLLALNRVGAAGATALGAALRADACLAGLSHVDLGYNCLGNAGAAEVGRALARRGTLRELGLDGNALGPRLPDTVAALTQLRSLRLRSNALESIPVAVPPGVPPRNRWGPPRRPVCCRPCCSHLHPPPGKQPPLPCARGPGPDDVLLSLRLGVKWMEGEELSA